MRMMLFLLAIGMAVFACVTPKQSGRTLRAPAGTEPAVVAMMEEGNRFFQAAQWDAARTQYEAAIKAQPSLAEAHYNLGWVLNALGDEASGRRHFMEAATLAPGNKVIWDSPPLRQHGRVQGQPKSGTPFIPALGGR
ncbi:MAG: tetratricopeptide repeat protein [Nitrospiraceae bacterium]